MRAVVLAALVVTILPGQALKVLTLPEAQEIAVKSNPRLGVAQLSARASAEIPKQVRANYFPATVANLTGVGADNGSRIAAGALNNPILYSRFGTGVTVSQLLTDFGRTSDLVDSARLRAQSQGEFVQAERADILLQVNRAYFSALRAQALVRVAEQTVAARQLNVDQITALAQSKLKSGLDVSFANVNLSEAKLLLARTQNESKAAFSELAASMGVVYEEYGLVEQPIPEPLATPLQTLIREAAAERPELLSLRLEAESARKFADSERALRLPTVSAVAAGGVVPARDENNLRGRYGAVGVSLSIPVFNGGLFASRYAEADLRAQAVARRVTDLENLIARDVRVAWLNMNTAFERLDLTRQLLDQASLALDLSQSRYDLGLSSIVELTQAQLNKTAAEIASTTAKYDYQLQRATLSYQVGTLR